MGASSFRTIAIGKDAGVAFREATQRARHESGHGGYTGTIAEKHGYKLFKLPPRSDPMKVANWAMRFDPKYDDIKTLKKMGVPERLYPYVSQIARVAGDKFGSAACLELTGSKAVEVRKRARISRGRVFLFFGMASS